MGTYENSKKEYYINKKLEKERCVEFEVIKQSNKIIWFNINYLNIYIENQKKRWRWKTFICFWWIFKEYK